MGKAVRLDDDVRWQNRVKGEGEYFQVILHWQSLLCTVYCKASRG